MLGKLLCAVKHGETLVNVFTQAIQSGPRHRIALMHRRGSFRQPQGNPAAKAMLERTATFLNVALKKHEFDFSKLFDVLPFSKALKDINVLLTGLLKVILKEYERLKEITVLPFSNHQKLAQHLSWHHR